MTQLTLTAPAAPLVPGPILVVGLNPSTADATTNDPTIAKLHRYTKAWGVPQAEPPIAYREARRLRGLPAARRYILTRPGLIMTNLFSLRSTDPRGLIGVGEEGAGSVNEDAIAEAAALAGTILCAWGGPYNPKALGEIVPSPQTRSPCSAGAATGCGATFGVATGASASPCCSPAASGATLELAATAAVDAADRGALHAFGAVPAGFASGTGFAAALAVTLEFGACTPSTFARAGSFFGGGSANATQRPITAQNATPSPMTTGFIDCMNGFGAGRIGCA